MSLLDDILASKRREVTALRAQGRRGSDRTPIDAVGALRRDEGGALRLIAEVKLRSPSAGVLSRALPPGERALAYAEAGAAMVSVLSDEKYFDGSWGHVAAARERLDGAGYGVAVLAKDYVLDERQIEEARDRGADAILLIARIVGPAELARLAGFARDVGVEPLVEVVDEKELEFAVAAEARIIGVNARDLDTLVMDSARAMRVCAAIPADVVAVHLSGLREPADVSRIALGRADAALVGEALMRDDDPRPRLRAMVEAARRGSGKTRTRAGFGGDTGTG
jgi:indole-3-glycerol phosphate synthase